MAGDGSTQADLGSNLVAHLADQDHVRVLAQGGAQHALEAQLDLFVDLHLVDAGQAVFDRILDGDDLLLGGVDLGQSCVQRRGLAAAGGPGHQHHAAGAMDRFAQAFEDAGRHAKMLQPQHA